jgi:hypothetical protein
MQGGKVSMRMTMCVLLLVAVLGMLLSGAACAVDPSATYTVTQVGANDYRYNFTVVGYDLTSTQSLYNLIIEPGTGLGLLTAPAPTAPAGWNAMLLPPGPTPVLSYNWSNGAGSDIAPGTSLGGFTFDAATLFNGPIELTTLANREAPVSLDIKANAVPEPGTLTLMLTGAPLLFAWRRRRQS